MLVIVSKALVPLAIFDQSQKDFKGFRFSPKKAPEYSIPLYRVKEGQSICVTANSKYDDLPWEGRCFSRGRED